MQSQIHTQAFIGSHSSDVKSDLRNAAKTAANQITAGLHPLFKVPMRPYLGEWERSDDVPFYQPRD